MMILGFCLAYIRNHFADAFRFCGKLIPLHEVNGCGSSEPCARFTAISE